MTFKLFLLMIIGAFSLLFVMPKNSAAQKMRQAVSATEVNGTYRSYSNGGKDSSDEIKILALGKGKLKVSFLLTYPYKDTNGALIANTGAAQGEATIDGDTAVYSSTDFGQCKITLKFVKPGRIKVAQSGTDSDCGFGFNVTADGNYKKVSRAKPKFDRAEQ